MRNRITMDDLIPPTPEEQKVITEKLREEAFREGMEAFKACVQVYECPYHFSKREQEKQWQKGWRVAERQEFESERMKTTPLLMFSGDTLPSDEVRDEVLRLILEHLRMEAVIQEDEVRLQQK